MVSALGLAAKAEMAFVNYQVVDLKGHVVGGAEVVGGMAPLAVDVHEVVLPDPVVATLCSSHMAVKIRFVVVVMVAEVVEAGEGEGEVLNEEGLTGVGEDHEQLPLVPELETIPLANASLEFDEKVAAIPHLAAAAASAVLRNLMSLLSVLNRKHFASNQGWTVAVLSVHFPHQVVGFE